jgi:hypothetical protein
VVTVVVVVAMVVNLPLVPAKELSGSLPFVKFGPEGSLG